MSPQSKLLALAICRAGEENMIRGINGKPMLSRLEFYELVRRQVPRISRDAVVFTELDIQRALRAPVADLVQIAS